MAFFDDDLDGQIDRFTKRQESIERSDEYWRRKKRMDSEKKKREWRRKTKKYSY